MLVSTSCKHTAKRNPPTCMQAGRKAFVMNMCTPVHTHIRTQFIDMRAFTLLINNIYAPVEVHVCSYVPCIIGIRVYAFGFLFAA